MENNENSKKSKPCNNNSRRSSLSSDDEGNNGMLDVLVHTRRRAATRERSRSPLQITIMHEQDDCISESENDDLEHSVSLSSSEISSPSLSSSQQSSSSMMSSNVASDVLVAECAVNLENSFGNQNTEEGPIVQEVCERVMSRLSHSGHENEAEDDTEAPDPNPELDRLEAYDYWKNQLNPEILRQLEEYEDNLTDEETEEAEDEPAEGEEPAEIEESEEGEEAAENASSDNMVMPFRELIDLVDILQLEYQGNHPNQVEIAVFIADLREQGVGEEVAVPINRAVLYPMPVVDVMAGGDGFHNNHYSDDDD